MTKTNTTINARSLISVHNSPIVSGSGRFKKLGDAPRTVLVQITLTYIDDNMRCILLQSTHACLFSGQLFERIFKDIMSFASKCLFTKNQEE